MIAQPSSIFFDQIERLRGEFSEHISEIILLEARKNPKIKDQLEYILNNGFVLNGIKYIRFGKSASQGKDGITAFVDEKMYEELYMITQMDISIQECVISKYEAQRCLVFSSCTLIKNYNPYIVIVDEYEKILPNQFIKYVVEKEKEFVDKKTGEVKKYNAREIEEGYRDIKLSPFDGCGCHEKKFAEVISEQLGLDYMAIGSQIRKPLVKGYSVYVPFKQIFKEWGYTEITDIYGKTHKIDDIDCIWNTSMFKGHKIFKEKYGNEAWIEYNKTCEKYSLKLGVTKYSHHIKNMNLKTRMNFQYLQCLDLWNSKYINHFENLKEDYNILDVNNQGKIISVAQYTTDLFEKIIKGDKFYTYKFMGITNTEDYESDSIYLKACLVNDIMLKDPAVRQYIYRKLKKSINEAKFGKIYVEGFYHTLVGDMIGYLQYVVGKDVIGCLKEHEFYSETLSKGDTLSFRSPLVCPSEVNKVKLVSNEITKKWFSYFKDQDVVMTNMYDLSLPQQGGADADGDAVLLCNNSIIVDSKINKPIIIDIEDKAMAKPEKYIKENITHYELNSRDNRIGEITNVATSIENKYTKNEEVKKHYSDSASLLRIFQGKEIDFLKTGLRWHMNKSLRNHLKKLPYFLLYNYPSKLKAYENLLNKNKSIEDKTKKYELNAYKSPSPMNELCEYINTWEKKNIKWDNSVENTKILIVNNNLKLTDKNVIKTLRHLINEYATEIKNIVDKKENGEEVNSLVDVLLNSYKKKAFKLTGINNEELIANYIINISYSNSSMSKSLAWAGYGEYIIKNLYNNSNPKKNISIIEVPYKTNNSYEYLGKYYEFKGCDNDV